MLCFLKVLRTWNIPEQKCTQNLRIRFPSFQVAGKSIEFGVQSIYPGAKRMPNIYNNRLQPNKHCFSLSDISLFTDHLEDLPRYDIIFNILIGNIRNILLMLISLYILL